MTKRRIMMFDSLVKSMFEEKLRERPVGWSKKLKDKRDGIRGYKERYNERKGYARTGR